MSSSILVGYATLCGSTQAVAEAIAVSLREAGLEVSCLPLHQVKSLAPYSGIIIGAPLIMFNWHKDARKFLSRHRRALTERPVAAFALGPVHTPHDEKEWADSRSHLAKALEQFPWFKPVALELFGGAFDPAKLRFPLNKFAGAEPASDIRNWDAINAWARSLPPHLAPPTS